MDKNSSILLIVEDDPFLEMLCQQKAVKAGYKVEIATDGEMAIEKIISLRPALVLLDLVLPKLDGFEVLKKIREHEEKKIAQTPIVIFSNLGKKEHVDKAMSLGANDFIVKSNFTVNETMEKIKKYFSE